MRILVVGAGGVGEAIAAIARRRGFFERMVLADIDRARAERVVQRLGDDRLAAEQLDASDEGAIVALAKAERADMVLNACDPRFNPPIFAAALAAGCDYLDMAMTLSRPDAEQPYERPGVKLGDDTPTTTSSPTSTRWRCATAPTWWWRATTSPPPSRSGPRSRSA
jgi:saccharopine dehydrogenase (NAD+, L-lysine-forming)